MEQEVLRLSVTDTIPFQQINQELRFHFKEVEKYSFAKATQVNALHDTIRMETIPVFLVKFNEGIKPIENKEKCREIAEWLKIRLNTGIIQVLEY